MSPSFFSLPAWALMWALAATLFALLKGLSWWPERRRFRALPVWRTVAYLTGWVGLDPAPFLQPRSPRVAPTPAEWVGAALQLALGGVLLWAPLPYVTGRSGPVGAWTGLAGLGLVLHFGLFRLLALAWRRLGVPVRPIMANPLAARSLGEFWGRRWNLAFRDVTHRFLFRPLERRHGARVALLAVFVGSGLVHEVVLSLPAGGGWGLPTLYFSLQGAAVLAERRLFAGSSDGFLARAFALGLAALPVPLLFHPPFLERVLLPFLAILGGPLGAPA